MLAIIIYPLPPSGKASHLLTVPLHDQHSGRSTTSAETPPCEARDIARNLTADGCGVRFGASPWVTALSCEFVMETQLNKLYHLVTLWGFNAPDPRLRMSLNRLDQTPWTRIHMLMHQFIHRAWFTARGKRCSPDMSEWRIPADDFMCGDLSCDLCECQRPTVTASRHLCLFKMSNKAEMVQK